MRAIKSVLVVAGSLKRGDPDRPEDQVLMRSLRDFNIPKIVTDDVPVFMGLIGDLFPTLDVPRRRDLDFEALVRKAIVDLKLQAEDNFVLKVCGDFPPKSCLSILYLQDELHPCRRVASDVQMCIYFVTTLFMSIVLHCGTRNVECMVGSTRERPSPDHQGMRVLMGGESVPFM